MTISDVYLRMHIPSQIFHLHFLCSLIWRLHSLPQKNIFLALFRSVIVNILSLLNIIMESLFLHSINLMHIILISHLFQLTVIIHLAFVHNLIHSTLILIWLGILEVVIIRILSHYLLLSFRVTSNLWSPSWNHTIHSLILYLVSL